MYFLGVNLKYEDEVKNGEWLELLLKEKIRVSILICCSRNDSFE